MDRESHALESQRHILEDAFFLKHDQVLIEKQRAIKRMDQSRHALTEVSGITDETVLQKLIELDIRPEIVASLAVVPLVAVAWADGRVDDKERQAILRGGAPHGCARGSVDAALLDRWLANKPAPELMAAWAHYVRGLCQHLADHEREALKQEILQRARAVAEATGGFLGLRGAISAEELGVLRTIERVFRDGSGLT